MVFDSPMKIVIYFQGEEKEPRTIEDALEIEVKTSFLQSQSILFVDYSTEASKPHAHVFSFNGVDRIELLEREEKTVIQRDDLLD
ncbi:hypothetical protein GGP85_002910 [Salinibacter ruber]|nr:hypothetical protein [Salinibacter ruber]